MKMVDLPDISRTRLLNMNKDVLPKKYIYIGRAKTSNHLGNPFTTHEPKKGEVKVKSREQAIFMFDQWLKGGVYQDLEPERRAYILKVCILLLGRTLVCHCKPLACHGDVLIQYAIKAKDERKLSLEELAKKS